MPGKAASEKEAPVAQESGWVRFAGIMFFVVGVLTIIFGLTMVLGEDWIEFEADEVWYLDITVWGWATVIIGVIAILIGAGVLQGQTWAAVVGVLYGALAFLEAFIILLYFPVWGVVLMVLWGLVIWSLSVHGMPESA